MNFSKTTAGSNRQDLKCRGQTTNQTQREGTGVFGHTVSNTHVPFHTPSWRPCCLLATGGQRPDHSADRCLLERSESASPESPETPASDLRDTGCKSWVIEFCLHPVAAQENKFTVLYLQARLAQLVSTWCQHLSYLSNRAFSVTLGNSGLRCSTRISSWPTLVLLYVAPRPNYPQ